MRMTQRRGKMEMRIPAARARNGKEEVGKRIGNVSAIVGRESVKR